MSDHLTYDDVRAAHDRIRVHIRPVTLAPADPGATPGNPWLALEYMQHTGTFKARGATNFLQAHRDAGTLPDTGVAIASGGNAGLACAWAAQQQSVPAPCSCPPPPPR